MNSEGILIFILILIRYSWASNKKDGLYCGRPIGTEFRIEERIVAGYDVGYYRYPWFAAIVSNGSVVCGGALIGPRTVLTAAHCYREYIKNPKSGSNLKDIYNVTLGIYNICEQETTRNVFLINKVNIHEQYEKMWPYCDLALLTLEGSTDNYETICLPRAPVSVRPKEGTVPGLGTLKYHGGTPCTLHEARILLYPDSDCKNMINRTGNDPSKLFKAFCAGYLQGGIDTCQGDSGGPLQVFDENGNYVLLGVVSYGFHCANPGLLGVYTDVSQHLDWIQEKMGPIGYDDSKNVNIAANQPHRKKTPVWAPIRIIIIQRKQMVVLKKKIKQTPIEILQNINK